MTYYSLYHPSHTFQDTLLNRYAAQIPDLLNDPTDPLKYTRNLLKFEVFYQEFNFEHMEEIPAYRVNIIPMNLIIT